MLTAVLQILTYLCILSVIFLTTLLTSFSLSSVFLLVYFVFKDNAFSAFNMVIMIDWYMLKSMRKKLPFQNISIATVKGSIGDLRHGPELFRKLYDMKKLELLHSYISPRYLNERDQVPDLPQWLVLGQGP